MVKVTYGNNVKRESDMFAPNTTLRAILEAKNIDYTRGTMNMDGSTLGPGDLDKTLADFGLNGMPGHDKCFLLNVVKVDNA